jgi:hypothetical protein
MARGSGDAASERQGARKKVNKKSDVLTEGRQNVTDWTGGQQPGFSSLSYVLKQFYRLSEKTGSADSPPPRWPPFPGNVSVERGVAA